MPQKVKELYRIEAVCAFLVTIFHILFLLCLAMYGVIVVLQLSPFLPDAIAVGGKQPYIIPDGTMSRLADVGTNAGTAANDCITSINMASVSAVLTHPKMQESLVGMKATLADMQVVALNVSKTLDSFFPKPNATAKPLYPWPASPPGIASMMRDGVDILKSTVGITKSLHVVTLYNVLFHLWPLNFMDILIDLQNKLGKTLEKLGIVFV